MNHHNPYFRHSRFCIGCNDDVAVIVPAFVIVFVFLFNILGR